MGMFQNVWRRMLEIVAGKCISRHRLLYCCHMFFWLSAYGVTGIGSVDVNQGTSVSAIQTVYMAFSQ